MDAQALSLEFLVHLFQNGARACVRVFIFLHLYNLHLYSLKFFGRGSIV